MLVNTQFQQRFRHADVLHSKEFMEPLESRGSKNQGLSKKKKILIPT